MTISVDVERYSVCGDKQESMPNLPGRPGAIYTFKHPTPGWRLEGAMVFAMLQHVDDSSLSIPSSV